MRFPKGKTVEIVGVVGDVRGKTVTKDPEPWSYKPAVNPTWGTIQVRSSMPHAQVIATIRDVARRIDPVVAPHDIQRRKEFGIRLALGARAGSVVGLVMRSAAVLTAIGLVLGLSGAAALRRLVESRLFGVSGLDPLTIGGTAVAIAVLTLLASLVPAVRAARVDPVRSLRVDA